MLTARRNFAVIVKLGESRRVWVQERAKWRNFSVHTLRREDRMEHGDNGNEEIGKKAATDAVARDS